MARKEILDRIQKYIHPFRVAKGKDFQLKHFDPGDTCGLKLDKGEAAELLQRGTQWLAECRICFTAQDRWSLDEPMSDREECRRRSRCTG